MKRREDNLRLAEYYSHFISPIVEAIGGVSAANRLFFEWKGRSDETPDYRDFFGAQINAERRVGAAGVFETGLFLHEQLAWCNPLVLLYAAGHLEPYVRFVSEMLIEGSFTSEISQIVNHVRMATLRIDLDRYTLPPVRFFFREKMGTFGAMLCNVYDDESRDDAYEEEEFDLYWDDAPTDIRGDDSIRQWFLARHLARRNCIIRNVEFMNDLSNRMKRWYIIDRTASLDLGIRYGELTLAHEVAQIPGLDPDLRNYGVDLHLIMHINGDGWNRNMLTGDEERTG